MGTVFELTPPEAGQTAWNKKTLVGFNTANGASPHADLMADNAGNLYGTTTAGRASKACTNGCGTVFKLTRPAKGKTHWTKTVLLSFSRTNGEAPLGGLLADSVGNLYGKTFKGGPYSEGTVFKLTQPAKGKTDWTATVLFSFNGKDGANPWANLLAGVAGSLFGTTCGGGTSGFGTVFKLMPPRPGQTAWTQTVLFAFHGADGSSPWGTLLADSGGTLYGAAAGGGVPKDCPGNGCSKVFSLTPPRLGTMAWTETVLASFKGRGAGIPGGGLVADRAGNLYGTTERGGDSDNGSLFKLTRPAKEKRVWTETQLFSFDGLIGGAPVGKLVADKAGNLYGTTSFGGRSKFCRFTCVGTVFKVTP